MLFHGQLEISNCAPLAAAQVDVGNAIHVVWSSEEPGVRAVVTGGERQTGQARGCVRNDVDAVPVVVEGHFVDERWADRIGGMDDGAIRRIAEVVADRRNVVSAPLAGCETLGDLFGDVVSEDGELAVEVMVDADDFFPQIRDSVGAALELGLWVSAAGCRVVGRENASRDKSCGVRIDHASSE